MADDTISPDHLYLTASIVAASSPTGFKMSVLRGRLRFRLSRSYVARSIDVYMEGFKTVRLIEKGNVNMNTSVEFRELTERICCISWDLGQDVQIDADQEYSYDFSALLDARLPRSIKVGDAIIYYRLTADIPNLRALKTETRLTVPWSRSAVMAHEELDYDAKPTWIQIDGHDDHNLAVLMLAPARAMKGPDRSTTITLKTSQHPVDKLGLTHADIELIQNVTMFLERLPQPHEEPPLSMSKVRGEWKNATQNEEGEWMLELDLPLPAIIHAEMVQNNHLHCRQQLALTLHRHGLLKRAKKHVQEIALVHQDLDSWAGKQMPSYETIMTQTHADPEYSYTGRDQKDGPYGGNL
ncbi:hypothetical protein PYCC9005_004159 [Savitreella phatthalungensis]